MIGFVTADPGLPSPILIQPYRAIGGIVANVTVEEIHRDELTITEHPVENNAAISDHAYKNPAEVRILCGWSNNSPQAGNDPNYVQAIYAQLLDLQQSRILFQIFTGKRVYDNMLIATLAVRTNREAETALFVEATCRQVIIVQTQTVPVSTNQSIQAMPNKTAGTSSTGPKQLQSAPNFNSAAAPH